MTWNDPRTWLVDEVETTTIFNEHLRDNMDHAGRIHDHSGRTGDGADLFHYTVLAAQVFGAHLTDAR